MISRDSVSLKKALGLLASKFSTKPERRTNLQQIYGTGNLEKVKTASFDSIQKEDPKSIIKTSPGHNISVQGVERSTMPNYQV